MTNSLYMTAEEAAEFLGVSVATLYAYVKRKGIRTQKLPGSRVSHYWREDVERAKLRPSSKLAQTTHAGLVHQTAITAITEGGPYYRGRSAIALSADHTLESVAALLWETDEARVFPPTPPQAPEILRKLWPIVEGYTAIDKASAAFPIIERANPRAYDLSPSGYTRTAGELMRWFAAMMVGRGAPSAEPLHEVVASRSDDPGVYGDLVRRLLVLSADHELDPTTYAARAVANSGATPYRIALGGFSAALGRRVAFGRIEALNRFLDEVSASSAPEDVVLARLRDGEALPGFGSQRYPDGDPRAASLLAAMDRALDGDRDLAKLKAVFEVVAEATGAAPDFSLANLYLGKRLNLSGQDGIVLRLGRIAGWIAHAMEQFHDIPLIRPRAAYVGLLPESAKDGD